MNNSKNKNEKQTSKNQWLAKGINNNYLNVNKADEYIDYSSVTRIIYQIVIVGPYLLEEEETRIDPSTSFLMGAGNYNYLKLEDPNITIV